MMNEAEICVVQACAQWALTVGLQHGGAWTPTTLVQHRNTIVVHFMIGTVKCETAVSGEIERVTAIIIAHYP